MFNSTHYIVLYPQNGDRIATIDSVTSLRRMYVRAISREITRVSKKAICVALKSKRITAHEWIESSAAETAEDAV